MAATLPKNYAPTEKEDYMNDKQLAYFAQKLNAWRDDLLRESRRYHGTSA